MNTKQDWIIRIYQGNRLVANWTIENRTLAEAKDEAMHDPRFAKHEKAQGFSWTLSAGYIGRMLAAKM